MPCLDLLSQLREAHPEITALGGDVLAVATGADYQARRLMAGGLPFPALVDPDKRLYQALGIERIAWDQWFRPSTWRRYARSLATSSKPRGWPSSSRPVSSAGSTVAAPSATTRPSSRFSTLSGP